MESVYDPMTLVWCLLGGLLTYWVINFIAEKFYFQKQELAAEDYEKLAQEVQSLPYLKNEVRELLTKKGHLNYEDYKDFMSKIVRFR